MNEHFVTSREWSERLKKAGVTQVSDWYWILTDKRVGFELFKKCPNHEFWFDPITETLVYLEIEEIYSAYLTDELAGMLPPSLTSDDVGEPQEYGSTWLTIEKDRKNWVVSYENSNHQMFIEQQVGYTLPNALAAMVAYLKREKII